MCAGLPGTTGNAAECRVEAAPSEEPRVFARHLVGDCTAGDRAAHAVTADDLLAKLKEGSGVDVSGVRITGNLEFDRLPLVPVSVLTTLPPSAKQFLVDRNVDEVRVIHGPLLIRDSIMQGALTTKLKEGYVVLDGPMSLARSTFEQRLDLSHMLFVGPVDASDAVFQREALFLQSCFTDKATFERTAFGPHSRFHRAMFLEPVSFLRSWFNGLAEFLEVTFEKDTSFSRTYFKMGTGFSGSRFGGLLDFSEAVFDRDVYFLFTKFDGDTYFRRSTFKGVADFSDAQFKGLEDFGKSYFAVEPAFARARLTGEPPRRRGLENPVLLYGIVLSLVVFTVLFVLILRRR